MSYTIEQINAINAQVSTLNTNITTCEALLLSTGSPSVASGSVNWDVGAKRLMYIGTKPSQRLLESSLAIKIASDASVVALISQAVQSANQTLGIKS